MLTRGINKLKMAKSLGLMTLVLLLLNCANNSNKKNNNTIKHKYSNALINETSPYLLQHAHNPVNWMPWGDEAFEIAKKENKLVIVSIGYSSCHWCHVMEHESFENETVAKLMNDYFVCIKVDREERPDVDQIYMTAVQLMTGSGGWPLNCFTLPDGRPVYGGTYFEKNQWVKVLENLQNTFKKEPQRLLDYANNLSLGIQQSELIQKVENPSEIKLSKLNELRQMWVSDFDLKYGGMNRTHKFPIPNNYNYLMQYAHQTNDTTVMKQVDLTLKQMANGGIYDHVGGGFARYSTDVKWKVPHFEKMLYDNAQLVSLYSKAFQRTKNPLYKKVVYQTLSWVNREMTTKEGVFYSALDADSDGEEGKYYVWSKAELKSCLTETEYKILKNYYEINANGLWEGNYILLKNAEKIYDLQQEKKIRDINTKLLNLRNKRVKPGLDDKSLTAWNALMLTAYVDAYSVFNDESFLNSALKNAKWLQKKQTQTKGQMYHTYKNGKSKINGFLDDYAFTIQAYIRLYEVTFNENWLNLTNELTKYVLNHFEDETSGMFYYTSNLDQVLITRKMEINDNVIPSSNSQMAHNLFKLGLLLDNKEYIQKSKQMLLNVYNQMHTYPSAYSNWSRLVLNIVKPYYQIAITGKNWQTKLTKFGKYYIPNAFYMGGQKSSLTMLDGKFLGETTIFVCEFGACKMPVNVVEQAVSQIE